MVSFVIRMTFAPEDRAEVKVVVAREDVEGAAAASGEDTASGKS